MKVTAIVKDHYPEAADHRAAVVKKLLLKKGLSLKIDMSKTYLSVHYSPVLPYFQPHNYYCCSAL